MSTLEQIEKSFTAGESPGLSVSNICGSITVRGEDRDDVRVTAAKRLDGRGDPERIEIEMRQEGDRVVVETRYQDGGSWMARLLGERACAVDYTVQVPADCTVRLGQVSGTIQVTGITGDVRVKAVSGVVRLEEVTGRTRVDAVSARVEGDTWRGQVRVKTVSGPVRIAAAHLSRLKAQTVSGNVALETTLDEAGWYDVHSISGDVSLYLPGGQGLEPRASTISGRFRCSLPHELYLRGRHDWRAVVNGGGPPLRFKSISGDLRVCGAQEAIR